MGATVRIEHVPAGWIEVFTSAGMQAVVDEAGQRIAAEAGEHFNYHPATHSNFTAAGFVGADEYIAEQEKESAKPAKRAYDALVDDDDAALPF